jgi:hypothetical protein
MNNPWTPVPVVIPDLIRNPGGLGLLRVPFVRTEDSLRIITVYWTSRIEKYWEGKSEDKV